MGSLEALDKKRKSGEKIVVHKKSSTVIQKDRLCSTYDNEVLPDYCIGYPKGTKIKDVNCRGYLSSMLLCMKLTAAQTSTAIDRLNEIGGTVWGDKKLVKKNCDIPF